MKKVLSMIALAALTTSMFVACGPSEAEKKAKEEESKRVADSLATAIQNSISAAVNEDTLKKEVKTDSAEIAKLEAENAKLKAEEKKEGKNEKKTEKKEEKKK